jgi:hypothetical protein
MERNAARDPGVHRDVMLVGGIGVLLVAAGSYVVVCSWSAVVINGRNARSGVDRHVSLVPVIGPFLISVGTLLLHVPAWRWWLAPWLVDIGTWTLVLFSLRTALT